MVDVYEHCELPTNDENYLQTNQNGLSNYYIWESDFLCLLTGSKGRDTSILTFIFYGWFS